MPVSDIHNIAPILAEVVRLQPGTILDLGIGFGKYGMLCREVLDGVNGRVDPLLWQTFIEGVEGHDSYRNPVWGAYNLITIRDFRFGGHWANFDLVLMIDSLEHCDKPNAYDLLDQLLESNKHVIVSVPLGFCPQGPVFGNELERHRSVWRKSDFQKYGPVVLHEGICLVVSMEGKQCAEHCATKTTASTPDTVQDSQMPSPLRELVKC
jgi:hypothetical protein